MNTTTLASSLVSIVIAGQCLGQQTLLEVPAPLDSGGGFGRSLGVLGDIDGDGLDDFIAGNPYEWGASVDEGMVVVISGRTGATLFRFRGSTFEALGAEVGAFDDLDGDGTGDFWMSSALGPGGGGSIRVHSGATGALIRSIDGTHAEHVGPSATSVGDIDADGVPDIATSIRSLGQVPAQAGGFSVRSGADGAEIYRVLGSQEHEFLGSSLATLPDLDGDGRAEVVVGAFGASTNGPESGAARIHSGADGALLMEFLGAHAGAQLGRSVRHGGDVDGDGHPDIVVTSRETGQGTNGPEEIFVYSTAGGAELHRFVAPGTDTNFGWTLGAGGDVDGDGRDDVAIGAFGDDLAGMWAGSLTLFSGATGAALFRMEGAPGSAVGYGAAMGGDLDGDGYDDVLVGAGYEPHPVTQQRLGVVFVVGHDHAPGRPLCFGVPNSTGSPATLVASSASHFSAMAADLVLDVASLPTQSLGYFIVSQSTGIVVAAGGSQGTLCISGPALGRFSGSVLNSGTGGAVTFQPDTTSIPQATAAGTTTVEAAPGDSFNFQYWYRDSAGASNFSGAACVQFR